MLEIKLAVHNEGKSGSFSGVQADRPLDAVNQAGSTVVLHLPASSIVKFVLRSHSLEIKACKEP
jgi:hypothetical protein